MDISQLEGIVRIGTVSSVNPTAGTARVAFPDMNNMVSGDLKYIRHELFTNEYFTPWAPKVGQSVLCLYIPVQDGDGFILGGI